MTSSDAPARADSRPFLDVDGIAENAGAQRRTR